MQITEEMPECTHSVTPTMPEISWSPPTERAQLSDSRLMVVAAGHCFTRWVVVPSRQETVLAMPGCGEEEMLAVACGRCRGRPVASCDQ